MFVMVLVLVITIVYLHCTKRLQCIQRPSWDTLLNFVSSMVYICHCHGKNPNMIQSETHNTRKCVWTKGRGGWGGRGLIYCCFL